MAIVATVIGDRRDKMPWSEVAGEVTAVFFTGVLAGGIVMLAAGAISSIVIDPDTGWEVQSETVYTVAEGSEIVVDGSKIEFVEVRDGKLADMDLYVTENVVYAEDSNTPRTVTVREEFRELGTALFPWGVGDGRNSATIK